ncbi:MAG: SpoIIE family protein phosphatase [Actinomycetota bacterium]|nr:SpoIIE family protein phosphatase [Actinomycetota bacterium]
MEVTDLQPLIAFPPTSSPLRIRTLLVEDDDGDAFLVQDLLEETAAPVELVRARTLAEATSELSSVSCVLLDLGLPDTDGLSAVQKVRELAPHAAVLVLTVLADEHLGVAAVAAGAQDYLVKGSVAGDLLVRSIRYAVERQRADESLRRLQESELRAEENARLERGLLPTPLTSDPALSCVTRYRPGRRRALLGGDFYDVLEDEGGALHVLIGDVAGHGPDQAALGVCLRIAWRTLVLAGLPPERILPILDDVLVRERGGDEVFATVCTLTVPQPRRTARLHLGGHPAPVLLGAPPVQLPDELVGPALGVVPGVVWGSVDVPLPDRWRLLLFTDGLIEGYSGGAGPDRLGVEGLTGLLEEADQRHAAQPGEFVDAVLDAVERQHGGELTDDVALVLVTCEPGTGDR